MRGSSTPPAAGGGIEEGWVFFLIAQRFSLTFAAALRAQDHRVTADIFVGAFEKEESNEKRSATHVDSPLALRAANTSCDG